MRNRFLRDTSGQMILWLAFVVAGLILFTGIAVDMGLIYMTKARLSNSVDSAVLMAARNFNLGQTEAQNLGNNMFWANFGSTSPTLAWAWCPGPAVGCTNAVAAGLTATTVVDTTFLGYLPALRVWTLGDTAQATRSELVMTIVLDRSGSMGNCPPPTCDNGGVALQNAVPNFVADFVPGTDYIGLISFASHSSIDVQITQQWGPPTNAIDNAVAAYHFTGGTFGTGAGNGTVYSQTNGPPLSMADAQNNSVTLPASEPETKVVVYFTDGLMNTIQDQFSTCPGQLLMNYGGADEDTTNPPWPQYVVSLDPTSENYNYCFDYYGSNDPENGGCQANGIQNYSTGAYCTVSGNKQTTFYSQAAGKQVNITRENVTAEAQYRAIYTADQMRQETPVATYIYVIGLSSAVSSNPCVEAFLSSVANDPNGSQYSCPTAPAQYNQALPQGALYVVPDCPSSQCTYELNQAFQAIATKVLLRLSK